MLIQFLSKWLANAHTPTGNVQFAMLVFGITLCLVLYMAVPECWPHFKVWLVNWCRHRPLPELVLAWYGRFKYRHRPALPDDPDEEAAKAALDWVEIKTYTLCGIDTMIMMNDICNLLQDLQPHDDLAPWAGKRPEPPSPVGYNVNLTYGWPTSRG